MPKPWNNCESCGAHLHHLVIGGMGDWRNKVVCRKCLHIRPHVPDHQLIKLLAKRYDTSEHAMRRAQSEIDRYYMHVVSWKEGDPVPNLFTDYMNETRGSISHRIRELFATEDPGSGDNVEAGELGLSNPN